MLYICIKYHTTVSNVTLTILSIKYKKKNEFSWFYSFFSLFAISVDGVFSYNWANVSPSRFMISAPLEFAITSDRKVIDTRTCVPPILYFYIYVYWQRTLEKKKKKKNRKLITIHITNYLVAAALPLIDITLYRTHCIHTW